MKYQLIKNLTYLKKPVKLLTLHLVAKIKIIAINDIFKGKRNGYFVDLASTSRS